MAEIAPTDADFDDMHHALGRPSTAGAGTYRNYYCCDVESDTAKRFEALDWWDFSHTINDGSSAIFRVNRKGREALAEWMRERAASPDRSALPQSQAER